MTSDAKLPIPSYDPIVVGDATLDWEHYAPSEPVSGDWCKVDDVRGLVERMEKSESQRDRLVTVLRDLDEHARWCGDFGGMTPPVAWVAARELLAELDKETT